MNEKRPDFAYIRLDSGKMVHYNAQTGEVIDVHGGNESLDSFEAQEGAKKLADYMTELEFAEANIRRRHPRFQEVKESWEYEKDPDELDELNVNPYAFNRAFDKEIESHGPTDDELMQEAREKKRVEKRLEVLRAKIKKLDSQGHSTSDLLDEYMQLAGIFPGLDL